jgi:ABC-2 type transport system permease protein
MATSTSRPNASSGIQLIIRRELSAYLGSWGGWALLALSLMVAGILFNTRAVGTSAKFSADVLGQFFHDSSGVVLAASFLVSLRTIVEERKQGTLPLLMNSSLSEGEIIFAKYIGAMSFLGLLLLLSSYIPALVFIRGKVSLGHIGSGYLGLLLYASAIIAVGIWASSLASGWVVAGAVSAATLAIGHTFWLLARRIDGSLSKVVASLSFHDKHFLAFKQGVISTKHVVFYLSVTIVFLMLARSGLESRRWSS